MEITSNNVVPSSVTVDCVNRQLQVIQSILRQHEGCLLYRICNKIDKHIKKTHPYGDLEIRMHCPQVYFLSLSKDWTAYIPIKRKRYFTSYKKCCTEEIFQQTFPYSSLTKSFITGDGKKIIMKIQITEETPARLLYSGEKDTLLLSFVYTPYPFIENYVPVRNRGIKASSINWKAKQQYLREYSSD